MASTSAGRTGAPVARTTLQTAALAVGVVFLVIGVLGFIPGVTSKYDLMEMAGHTSHAKLLGIFQISILHNVVHLLFGVAGLLLSRSFRNARMYFLGGGVIYLLLTVYGLVTGKESSANFVPLNLADDGLHLVLGIGMLGLGIVLGRRSDVYSNR